MPSLIASDNLPLPSQYEALVVSTLASLAAGAVKAERDVPVLAERGRAA